MGFFSDMWEGAKQVAGGIGKIMSSIVDVLIEGAFFLMGIVFDAVVKIFEWIDDTIDAIVELVGSFFVSEDKPGESVILPPTPDVITVIEKYDKIYGTDHVRHAKQGNATLGVIQDGNGKIVGTRIVGSDRGFDSQINSVHKRNRAFANKIKLK